MTLQTCVLYLQKNLIAPKQKKVDTDQITSNSHLKNGAHQVCQGSLPFSLYKRQKKQKHGQRPGRGRQKPSIVYCVWNMIAHAQGKKKSSFSETGESI